MSVSYPFDQRARAKHDGMALVTIDVDGRNFPKGCSEYRGRITYQGAVDGVKAQKILNLIAELRGEEART